MPFHTIILTWNTIRTLNIVIITLEIMSITFGEKDVEMGRRLVLFVSLFGVWMENVLGLLGSTGYYIPLSGSNTAK